MPPYYDVFIGLQDVNDGDIWIYKPVGWVPPNPPGNVRPTISITSPATGVTHVTPATVVNLTANAADADGSITRVEYYVNGDKVGQAWPVRLMQWPLRRSSSAAIRSLRSPSITSVE